MRSILPYSLANVFRNALLMIEQWLLESLRPHGSTFIAKAEENFSFPAIGHQPWTSHSSTSLDHMSNHVDTQSLQPGRWGILI